MKNTTIFTRNLYKLATMALTICVFTVGAAFAADNETWDKTFTLSDKVIHEKVSYPNRYGITLVADMYVPKDIDRSQQYPALVVGTPYGGVKEQGAGIYAQTMAERGFVAIAFDEPGKDMPVSRGPEYLPGHQVATLARWRRDGCYGWVNGGLDVAGDHERGRLEWCPGAGDAPRADVGVS